MKRFITFAAVILFTAACNNNSSNDKDSDTLTAINTVAPPANINYNIVNTYPHDTSSYTQGLIWQNNTLYEGTGMWGHSHLLQVDIKNGKSNKSVSLDSAIFGEGITMLNDKIYQLTWENHKVYVYDAKTFKKLKELTWDHEGWGLTNNGADLIVSTGESNLYFVDPETFKIRKIVGVSDNNGSVGNLNELEFVDGTIYSNVYLTDLIIKIDPANGHVIGKIDLGGLLAKAGKHVDTDEGYVLNGIAYDSTRKSLYITGKKWPLLFEMKVN